jgi:hypothetical protein
MPPNDQNEKPHGHLGSSDLPDAENPVTQASGPGGIADQEAIARDSRVGINPQNTGSMSRAEDDEEVREHSPEFSDRPGQGTKVKQKAGVQR